MTIRFDIGHDLERWGVRIYRIMTGVTSDVGMPSTRLVPYENSPVHDSIIVVRKVALLKTNANVSMLEWCWPTTMSLHGYRNFAKHRNHAANNKENVDYSNHRPFLFMNQLQTHVLISSHIPVPGNRQPKHTVTNKSKLKWLNTAASFRITKWCCVSRLDSISICIHR